MALRWPPPVDNLVQLWMARPSPSIISVLFIDHYRYAPPIDDSSHHIQFELRTLSNQCTFSHSVSHMTVQIYVDLFFVTRRMSSLFNNDHSVKYSYFISLVITCCLITLAYSQPLP